MRRVARTGLLLVALYASMFAWGAAAASAGVFDSVRVSSGDLTTTSTSFVDATGLTLTATTGADRVMVAFSATGAIGASAQAVVTTLLVDGTNVGGAGGLTLLQSATGGQQIGFVGFTYVSDVLSAGSHTFKVQWRSTNSGTTATLYAGSGRPALLSVVEQSSAASSVALHDLTDVNDAGKTAGSVLKYDTATSKWIVGTDSTSSGGGTTVATDGCDGTASANTQCVQLAAPVELQQDTTDRLDLLWWGVWFLAGLTLMVLLAPSMERAFRWWQGGLS